MINRWTDKELSEMDDITFAISILSKNRAVLSQETPFAKKLASACRTLAALRGGQPINITYEDILTIVQKNDRQASNNETLKESDGKVAFRVEFETAPIRHLAVRCPHCNIWMRAQQASNDHIPDMVVAEFSRYECTNCDHRFCPAEFGEIEVEECDSANQVYRDCVG